MDSVENPGIKHAAAVDNRFTSVVPAVDALLQSAPFLRLVEIALLGTNKQVMACVTRLCLLICLGHPGSLSTTAHACTDHP